MTATKAVINSPLADEDIAVAFAYYVDHAGAQVAGRFVAALDAARKHIGRQPGTGSPRYAHATHLPGLRSWPLKNFPHVLFYFEQPDAIDVIRLLQASSDIAAWLTSAEGD